MSLIERIQQGKDLIVCGRSLGKDTTDVEAEVKNLQCLLQTEVSQLKLSEFKNRHIALPYDSLVLGEYVWLCSNNEMAAKIRRDDPEVVTYTVDELRELLHLNPNPDDLLAIHNAKSVFLGSRVIESNLKKKNEGKEN